MESRPVPSKVRIHSIRRLSNQALAAQIDNLNTQKHALDAELILYLSELERRRLYREYAYASLFEFCVSRLGCSEDVAYKRVGAARMMQQFPMIFELLANGRIHLTGLMLLRPHLTVPNHREWLLAASGKSKRQIEQFIAARLPRPDVPASVRKLPDANPPSVVGDESSITSSNGSATEPSATEQSATVPSSATDQRSIEVFGTAPSEPAPPLAPVHPRAPETLDASQSGASQSGASQSGASQSGALQSGALQSGASQFGASPSAAPNAARTARVVPLSSASYRVVFTASKRLKEKLDRAGELLSHAIPSNDLPAVIERALDQLIEREEQRRYGLSAKSAASKHSREAKENPVIGAAAQPTKGHCDLSQRQTPPLDLSLRETPDPKTPESNLHSLCQKRSPGLSRTQDPDPKLCVGARQRSRNVSAAVRREVFIRDHGQCTFVDPSGRRCEQRRFLEFDHCEAFAVGGDASIENIRIRCRSHNALEAEKLFGPNRIAGAIASARKKSAR